MQLRDAPRSNPRTAPWLSEVLRVCIRKVFVHQRTQARAVGIDDAKGLAVCFVQRFGSLLQLNPHGHAVVPDGVLYRDTDGTLAWHELPAPTDAEVEAVGLAIVKGVLRILERRGTREDSCGDEVQDAEIAMTHALAAAVVTPRAAPAMTNGREERGALSARAKQRTALIDPELGAFSFHANTSIAPADRAGLERLLRYCGRPALAHQRLSMTPAGKVSYRLRKPYYTGQTELVLEPLAFLRRLVALVPPARCNQVRYYGLLAAQSHDRDALLRLVPTAAAAGDSDHPGTAAGPAAADTAGDRSPATFATRMRWAQLLARIFGHQLLTCPHCQHPRTIIAAITEPDLTAKLLTHLGLPTDLPELARARPPPQPELFADHDHNWPVA